jgi:hypothetical protein
MNHQQPVSFPGWKGVLAHSSFNPEIHASHSREIITFLHHCKKTHSPVSVELIRQWLANREKMSSGPAHLALRWFYREWQKTESSKKVGPDPAPTVPNIKIRRIRVIPL